MWKVAGRQYVVGIDPVEANHFNVPYLVKLSLVVLQKYAEAQFVHMNFVIDRKVDPRAFLPQHPSDELRKNWSEKYGAAYSDQVARLVKIRGDATLEVALGGILTRVPLLGDRDPLVISTQEASPRVCYFRFGGSVALPGNVPSEPVGLTVYAVLQTPTRNAGRETLARLKELLPGLVLRLQLGRDPEFLEEGYPVVFPYAGRDQLARPSSRESREPVVTCSFKDIGPSCND